MNFYTINRIDTGKTIFSGHFQSRRRCVEQAVTDEVSLFRADLRNANLLNATLDGGDFRQADFTGGNLSGANASECKMQGGNFTNATLHGAVLCESMLEKARFDGALFGATDVFACALQHCFFSTLSAFTLNFSEAATMIGSLFENPCGTRCPLSRPPIVIHGMGQPVIIMDRHFKIGAEVHEIGNLDTAGKTGRIGRIHPAALRLQLEQLASYRSMSAGSGLTFHNKRA